jgi:hypothetical protein
MSAMVLSDLKDMSSDDRLMYYAESDGNMSGASTPGERQRHVEITEVKSGIRWKFANQGLNLLDTAVEESSTISQDSGFGDVAFARQLYLHGITYLLRALPSDLSTEERLSVRSALPLGIVEHPRLDSLDAYTSQTQSQINISDPPSLLHRTLALTIVQLFIIFQFVLPYLQYLLRAAYQYDRTHKISEKVLSQGIVCANILGKAGIAVTGSMYGMNDGKVGQMITETATWLLEGVMGGVYQGVGEGLIIIGAMPRRE